MFSTEKVLDRGLDQGTAFEILSIDIADVDLGENRGAALRSSQASADKEVAQAQAEIRRAAAVALEQEQRKKRGKIKRSERRAYDKILRKTFEENAKLAREGDQEAKNKMVGCVAAARLLREQTEENRVAHGQAR